MNTREKTFISEPWFTDISVVVLKVFLAFCLSMFHYIFRDVQTASAFERLPKVGHWNGNFVIRLLCSRGFGQGISDFVTL